MIMPSVKKAVEVLNSKVSDFDIGNPYFSDPRYISKPFDKNNFKILKLKDSGRKLAFIDGGNLEILNAPNFSVHVSRIYFSIFSANKKLMPKSVPSKIEFYTVCFTKVNNGRVVYEVSLIPVDNSFVQYLPDENDLVFDSFDPTIAYGIRRATPSKVSAVARRFCEWKYATCVIDRELDAEDVLIRDGTLQTAVTNESKYSNNAYQSAENKGVIFAGLSKTCSLFTSTGTSLIYAVRKLAETAKVEKKSWYYHPIVDNQHPDHKADIYLVKLNPDADYVFRFEIYREQAKTLKGDQIEKILSPLASNSTDMAFLGYPFGLIDAHLGAKVSFSEIENLRALFLSELSSNKLWDKFSKFLRAGDAHEVLNKL
jgi:hypothetical protein